MFVQTIGLNHQPENTAAIAHNQSQTDCVLSLEKAERKLFPFFCSFLFPLLKTSVTCELKSKGRWLWAGFRQSHHGEHVVLFKFLLNSACLSLSCSFFFEAAFVKGESCQSILAGGLSSSRCWQQVFALVSYILYHKGRWWIQHLLAERWQVTFAASTFFISNSCYSSSW